MRRAEITILTILFTLVGSLISMYVEKEYDVTLTLEKSLEGDRPLEQEYPSIIITDT